MALEDSGEKHTISAVRAFNRFYTERLGLLGRRHLNGDFSLTEARVLYEISVSPGMRASSLLNLLGLSAGYVSRILASLARRKLVRKTISKHDRRERLLSLLAAGESAVSRLNDQSSSQIQGLLASVSLRDRLVLTECLAKVREILSRRQDPFVRIVRLYQGSDDASELLREYYEAVHVVQRDSLDVIQKIIDSPRSGVWLAYLNDKPVGCVVLRQLSAVPLAAECKRLYVRPTARGNRIAHKLLDVQESFAREQGIRWIYLDSYGDLKAAIALYRKRGYGSCARYNDNPQATVFMRKKIT